MIKTVILVFSKGIVRMLTGKWDLSKSRSCSRNCWLNFEPLHIRSSNYVCYLIHKIEHGAAVVSSFVVSRYPLVETSSTLAERGDPRPTEQCGLLQDETHNQVGSRVCQLPQFSLSLTSHFWRMCWKMWWCFSSFGGVWKAEALVGLVALLGMPGVLLCFIDPSASGHSKASISVQ